MRRATLGAGEVALSIRDGELRLLEYAVAASIALHLLALAALQAATPQPEPVASAPAAMSARLVEPQAAAAPVASPPSEGTTSASSAAATEVKSETKPLARSEPGAQKPEQAEPKVELSPSAETARRIKLAPKVEAKIQSKPKPKPEPAHPSRPKPKPDQSASTRPKPKSEPAHAADAESTTPAPALAPSALPTTSPGALASAAPVPTPGPSGAAIDEDLVARYRLQLISAARRYKRYPRAALDNQWEGATEVAMLIGENGRIREITISQSSGHEVLDRQAIDMFRKAKPLVAIPAELRGREFRVTLKAIYSLRDPGA